MPYKLAVSFEIKWEDTDEGQKEYAEIDRALNAAIKADLTGDDWWSENTAYYVLNTREAPEKFVVRARRECGKTRTESLFWMPATGPAWLLGNSTTKPSFRSCRR